MPVPAVPVPVPDPEDPDPDDPEPEDPEPEDPDPEDPELPDSVSSPPGCQFEVAACSHEHLQGKSLQSLTTESQPGISTSLQSMPPVPPPGGIPMLSSNAAESLHPMNAAIAIPAHTPSRLHAMTES